MNMLGLSPGLREHPLMLPGFGGLGAGGPLGGGPQLPLPPPPSSTGGAPPPPTPPMLPNMWPLIWNHISK